MPTTCRLTLDGSGRRPIDDAAATRRGRGRVPRRACARSAPGVARGRRPSLLQRAKGLAHGALRMSQVIADEAGLARVRGAVRAVVAAESPPSADPVSVASTSATRPACPARVPRPSLRLMRDESPASEIGGALKNVVAIAPECRELGPANAMAALITAASSRSRASTAMGGSTRWPAPRTCDLVRPPRQRHRNRQVGVEWAAAFAPRHPARPAHGRQGRTRPGGRPRRRPAWSFRSPRRCRRVSDGVRTPQAALAE